MDVLTPNGDEHEKDWNGGSLLLPKSLLANPESHTVGQAWNSIYHSEGAIKKDILFLSPSTIDKNVTAALPKGSKTLSVTTTGISDYCTPLKIEVQLPNGSHRAFFHKGPNGYQMMHSAYLSETSLYQFIPEHTPRPIAFGPYASQPDVSFLSEFTPMQDEETMAKPETYMAPIIKLHTRSKGHDPHNGKFGFEADTYFGMYELNNSTWEPSWERFFSNQLRKALEQEEKAHGPHTGLDGLEDVKKIFVEKVIPRYLRLLQSDRRTLTPCLVHSDLWPGNVRMIVGEERACLFDSCAFWGHNEDDLGVFSNSRYKLGKPYLEEYYKNVPVSEPVEDFEGRRMVYF